MLLQDCPTVPRALQNHRYVVDTTLNHSPTMHTAVSHADIGDFDISSAGT